MAQSQIDKVIDDFEDLPLESKEYTLELLNKILTEARREEIFQNTQKSESEYMAGNTKTGTPGEIINWLEND